jgi:hypothetical protein
MSPLHDGIRKETRTRFIEGEGWHVEEVEVGTPISAGQSVLAMSVEPAKKIIVTIADVPLSLALEVIKENGMVAVPVSFLNEEQLEELKIDLSEVAKSIDAAALPADPEAKPAEKMTDAQAIKAIKAAASFEELNALTALNTSVKVLSAAEARAAELKG